MIYQVIYSSDATTPMQTDDLEEILRDARDRNAKFDITGALVYTEGVFLQVLEGPKNKVLELIEKIAKDLRNESLIIMQEGEIPARLFGEWKMAYVSATSSQIAQWAGLNHETETALVLEDLRQDAHKIAQVTQSILSSLAPDTDDPSVVD